MTYTTARARYEDDETFTTVLFCDFTGCPQTHTASSDLETARKTAVLDRHWASDTKFSFDFCDQHNTPRKRQEASVDTAG